MEEKFLSFAAEVMDVDLSEISMDTQYKEYAVWDSLMMLTLIMEIENEYSITIPMEKVEKINSLGDLYELTQA